MLRLAGLILALTWFAAEAPRVQAGAACTCRANGQKYEQGQILCIRGKLARCAMQLNNPTWKVLADSCPETRFTPVPSRLFAASRRLLPQSSLPSC